MWFINLLESQWIKCNECKYMNYKTTYQNFGYFSPWFVGILVSIRWHDNLLGEIKIIDILILNNMRKDNFKSN